LNYYYYYYYYWPFLTVVEHVNKRIELNYYYYEVN
jgi:hypothetical protein